MKRIGIAGFGYVGKAVFNMVKDHYAVAIVEPSRDQLSSLEIHLDPEHPLEDKFQKIVVDKDIDHVSPLVHEQIDLWFICVPTPSNDDGSCNTSIVESILDKIPDGKLVLIKSTVAPGTTDRLQEKYPGKRIAFSPEYIGEGKYHVTPRMDFQRDMKKCPFFICGGPKETVKKIFDALIPILGPEKTYYQCDALDAEVIKYMENTYFGVKITFAQEMYEVCRVLGADWYKVWQGWALDPRVDIMHTAVFPESRGFGGKCLPKDLNAIVSASIEKGFYPTMLAAMLKSNAQFRPSEPVRAKNV